jgi:hypothetical protein
VVALDSTLVSTLVAITVAPTSTPPAASVTVPLNWERATCACATPPNRRQAATTNDWQALIFMFPRLLSDPGAFARTPATVLQPDVVQQHHGERVNNKERLRRLSYLRYLANNDDCVRLAFQGTER